MRLRITRISCQHHTSVIDHLRTSLMNMLYSFTCLSFSKELPCNAMKYSSCNVMETYFVETNIWYLSCLMFCLVLVCYVLLCSVMSCHGVISHVTQCDAMQCNVSYDIVCAVWYGMIWHMLTHKQ